MFNLVLMATWLEPVLTAVGLGIAGLIALLFARLNSWIATKIKDEKLRKSVLAVSEIVQSSVFAIQQTFVSQLKKDGKFDKVAQAKALEEASKLALANISDEVKEQVKVLYPDFEKWLMTLIEAAVYSSLPHKN